MPSKHVIRTLCNKLYGYGLILATLLPIMGQAQEIEARAYSNAPIGMNFITAGIAQAKSGSYLLNTEAVSLTHVLDLAGQSGRLTLTVPYAELSGVGRVGGQSINASAEGLSDPMIKASVNLYGAPALTNGQFSSYQQDLIIGASLAATIPWGKYNSSQMVNVGGNRSLIQPAAGLSQAIGAWRLELAGMATIYTSNTNYMGSNTLSQNPVYSGETHASITPRTLPGSLPMLPISRVAKPMSMACQLVVRKKTGALAVRSPTLLINRTPYALAAVKAFIRVLIPAITL